MIPTAAQFFLWNFSCPEDLLFMPYHSNPFFVTTCASQKILLRAQTCERSECAAALCKSPKSTCTFGKEKKCPLLWRLSHSKGTRRGLCTSRILCLRQRMSDQTRRDTLMVSLRPSFPSGSAGRCGATVCSYRKNALCYGG